MSLQEIAFSLLSGLKKEIQVGKILDFCDKARSGKESRVLLDTVSFCELQCESILENDCANLPELHSLKKLLIGRSKLLAQDEVLNSAVFLFAEWTNNALSFSVELNTELFDKISEVLNMKPVFLRTFKIYLDVLNGPCAQMYGHCLVCYKNQNDFSYSNYFDIKSGRFGCCSQIFRIDILQNIPDEWLKLSWKITVRGIVQNQNFKIRSDRIIQNPSDYEPDFTIAASNGAHFNCHRQVLIDQSKTFEIMLTSGVGMMEARTGRIEMRLNSEEAIRQLVRFLYGLEIVESILTPDLALELIQLAQMYLMSDLVKKMKNFLLLKHADWFTVNCLVELYFFTKMCDMNLEDLKFHALIIMARLPMTIIETCGCFGELDKDGKAELIEKVELFKN